MNKERQFRNDGIIWITAIALIFLHCIAAWILRQTVISAGHDDAQYLILSQSILDFAYRDEFLVGQPSHHMYPPVYPLALAGWGKVVGDSLGALSALNIVSTAGMLFLLFSVLKRVFSVSSALFALAVLSVNPELAVFSGKISTEMPLATLTMLALWYTSSKHQKTHAVVGATIAVIAAALTRSVGICVVAAIFLDWLLARRVRAVVLLGLTSLIFLGLWFAWSAADPAARAGRSYYQDAALIAQTTQVDFLSAIYDNGLRIIQHSFRYLMMELPTLFALPSIPNLWLDNIIWAGFISIPLVVGYISFFREWRTAALYLLISIGLLAIWPYFIPRFLIPLMPLFAAMIVIGWNRICRTLRAPFRRVILICVPAILIGFGSFSTASLIQQRGHCSAAYDFPLSDCVRLNKRSFFEAMRYIRESLPKGAVVRSGKPATVYYMTGHVGIPRTQLGGDSESNSIDKLRDLGVDYILLSIVHSSSTGVAYNLHPHCQQLQMEAAFRNESFVLKILPPNSPPVENSGCQALQLAIDRIEYNDQKEKNTCENASMRFYRAC